MDPRFRVATLALNGPVTMRNARDTMLPESIILPVSARLRTRAAREGGQARGEERSSGGRPGGSAPGRVLIFPKIIALV